MWNSARAFFRRHEFAINMIRVSSAAYINVVLAAAFIMALGALSDPKSDPTTDVDCTVTHMDEIIPARPLACWLVEKAK